MERTGSCFLSSKVKSKSYGWRLGMVDGSDSKIDKIYTIQSIQYNIDPHVLPPAAKGPYLLVTGN